MPMAEVEAEHGLHLAAIEPSSSETARSLQAFGLPISAAETAIHDSSDRLQF